MWRRLLLPSLLGLLSIILWVGAARWFSANAGESYQRALSEFRRGAFAESLKQARKGASRWDSRDGGEWHWKFRLLEAEILLEQGQTAQALEVLENGIEASRGFPEIDVRRRVLKAKLHLRQGRFKETLSLLDEAAPLASRDGLASVKAEIYLLRGQTFGRLKNTARAEDAFQEALESAVRANDLFRQASASTGLGMIRVIASRCDEALPFFLDSLSIARRLQADHSVVGAANNLGMCYSHLGDFDKAMEYRQEALRLVRPSARLAEVQGETGSLHMLQQQPEKAIPYYRSALETAKEYKAIPEAARWASNLTSALVSIEDWAGAERANAEALDLNPEPRSRAFLELNTAAVANGRGRTDEARGIYERLIETSSDNPSVLWQSHASLANLHLVAGDTRNANRHYEAAIGVIERSRSDLSRSEHKITFLARLIRFYQDYVEALVDQRQTAHALAVADSCRARILAERLSIKVAANGAAGSNEFQAIAESSKSIWLSYWIAPRRSFLWVVTSGRIHEVVLPRAEQIARQIEQYQTFIEESLRDPLKSQSQAGAQLFETLIGPARPLIPRGSRVIVVPDGPLHRLNFETLPVYGEHPHYWIEDATIAIAPSFGVFLRKSPVGSGSGRPALVIGDPESPGPEYPKLANAAAEISSVAKRFSAAKVITGAAARPAVYAETNPGQFSVIHIAAHAEANRQSPLDSAVILSPGNAGFKLYARDVMDVPLKADLVTISACRSSGARTYAGEGLVGFAWAFLQAGARSVIAGLWDVPDSSTALLMDRMYARIEEGTPPVDALRAAKLSLIGTDYAKPYYWGPFQVYIR